MQYQSGDKQSGGDKNVLTAEEIAQCKCIIIAADKEVKMARFDGRPLIVTKVADGIHKPKELIEKALSGTAAVYHSNSKDDISGSGIGEEKLGRKYIRH